MCPQWEEGTTALTLRALSMCVCVSERHRQIANRHRDRLGFTQTTVQILDRATHMGEVSLEGFLQETLVLMSVKHCGRVYF